MNFEFSSDVFQKIPKFQTSRKSVQWGAELFHIWRQTDRHDEANFRKRQKKWWYLKDEKSSCNVLNFDFLHPVY